MLTNICVIVVFKNVLCTILFRTRFLQMYTNIFALWQHCYLKKNIFSIVAMFSKHFCFPTARASSKIFFVLAALHPLSIFAFQQLSCPMIIFAFNSYHVFWVFLLFSKRCVNLPYLHSDSHRALWSFLTSLTSMFHQYEGRVLKIWFERMKHIEDWLSLGQRESHFWEISNSFVIHYLLC